MNQSHITRMLIDRFYDELWNQWNDGAVDEVLTEDFDFRGSLGQHTVGRDGWRRYRDGIRVAAPDFHNEIVTLVVDDTHAAARLSYSGTHRGPLLGVPATGRSFSYAGAAFFTVSGQRLAAAWILGDLQTLRAQLTAPA